MLNYDGHSRPEKKRKEGSYLRNTAEKHLSKEASVNQK